MPMEEMKMYPVRKFNVAEAALFWANAAIAAEGVMDHEE